MPSSADKSENVEMAKKRNMPEETVAEPQKQSKMQPMMEKKLEDAMKQTVVQPPMPTMEMPKEKVRTFSSKKIKERLAKTIEANKQEQEEGSEYSPSDEALQLDEDEVESEYERNSINIICSFRGRRTKEKKEKALILLSHFTIS